MPVVRRAAKAAAAPTETASQGPPEPPSRTSAQRRQWAGWRRRAEVYDVMSLYRTGASTRQISRDLALARHTVRRWLRGEQPDPCRPRVHSLDPWRALLERRWAEGCRRGAGLWREAREAGAGGLRVVTERANRQRLADPVMGLAMQRRLRPQHAALPASLRSTCRRSRKRSAPASSGSWRCRRHWMPCAASPAVSRPWCEPEMSMHSIPGWSKQPRAG